MAGLADALAEDTVAQANEQIDAVEKELTAKPDDLTVWWEDTKKQLPNFNDPKALVSSYIELRRKLSEDPKKYIPKPDPKVPESMDAYFKALGRPDTKDDYTVDDTGLAASMKNAAFEVGLTKDQFERVFTGVTTAIETANKATEDDLTMAQNKFVEDTRKEWGVAADTNMRLINKALTVLGNEEFRKLVVSDPMMSTSKMLRDFLVEAGKVVSEGAYKAAKSIDDATPKTVAELQAELNAFVSANAKAILVNGSRERATRDKMIFDLARAKNFAKL